MLMFYLITENTSHAEAGDWGSGANVSRAGDAVAVRVHSGSSSVAVTLSLGCPQPPAPTLGSAGAVPLSQYLSPRQFPHRASPLWKSQCQKLM